MTKDLREHISALLRGQSECPGLKLTDIAMMVRLADEHGVSTLLYSMLEKIKQRSAFADALYTTLRPDAYQQIARESCFVREIQHVIAILSDKKIDFLLLKGTPLAYLSYPQACLRPRADTDILIAREDCAKIKTLLTSDGFKPDIGIDGTVVTHQFAMSKETIQGFSFTLDIHWKITNPHAFANLLTYDELLHGRQPIPKLSENGYAPSSLYLLAHALIHRAAHFHDRNRLIWLYDIFLLAKKLDHSSQKDFVQLCNDKKINAVCVDGLEAAYKEYGGEKLLQSIQSIALNIDSQREAATAQFLRTRFGMLARFRSDWRSLRWPQRLQLLREHCFPSVQFMRRRYGQAPLPLLYLNRFGNGIKRLLSIA